METPPSESNERGPDYPIIKKIKAFEEETSNYRKLLPQVEWEHVQLGAILGRGAFSTVHQAYITDPILSPAEETMEDGELDFVFSSSYQQSYALKRVSRARMNGSKRSFEVAATDLITEAEFLAQLDHENIIAIHGVCAGDVADAFADVDHMGYFLVLDLLYCTLREKLSDWKKAPKRRRSLTDLVGMVNQNRKRADTHSKIIKRLKSAGIQVAKGMEYIHAKDIILRDLKPENIGFDPLSGNYKIFDFGLARHLNSKSCQVEVAGSVRYMAPETRLRHGSSKASDVYSFGILLWELCALKKPFDKFKTLEAFDNKVLLGNWRPHMPKSAIPSKTLRHLIRSCWDGDEAFRPSFGIIVARLKTEIEATIREENFSDLDSTAGSRLMSSCSDQGSLWGSSRASESGRDTTSQTSLTWSNFNMSRKIRFS